jgi:hypothetical protein
MTLVIAVLLCWLLLVVAALHAYWGGGGLWPAASERELVATVIGHAQARRMPPPWLCILVAIAIGVAAVWPMLLVGVEPGAPSRPLIVAGGVAILLVFLLRGLAGYLPVWRRLHPQEPFAAYDRRFYAPLCLQVAAGYAILLLQGR